MRKIPATSRADLLALLAAPGGLDAAAAAVLGFHREPSAPPKPSPPPPRDPAQPSGPAPVAPPPPPAARLVFPTEYPRLPFLAARIAETLQPETPPARGHPISDAELAVDWSLPGPPLAPLTRWARLAPFLRRRLGAMVPGARLDWPRLFGRVGRGLPVLALPRVPRPTWAARAVVLRDTTEEMFPFARDLAALLQRLQRERGKHGLVVCDLRQPPRRAELARIPAAAPVLALSAMGCFKGGEAVRDAWTLLARRLAFRGQTFHALNPAPRDRWETRVATAWPSAVWDRRPRLPRRGGLRALAPALSAAGRTDLPLPGPLLHPMEEREKRGAADAPPAEAGTPYPVPPPPPPVERLLDLLAPATRIEPPLLRAARLRLGHGANAGTEWDAWHHAACWHSLDCFGFQPGAHYDARLARRGAPTNPDAPLAAEIGALMRRHHETCSSVIRAEAELRACLSGAPETQALAEVCALLTRVVDRLRLLAAEPASEAGRASGLPAWFPGMVERLPPAMRAHPEVAAPIARGLALAHAFCETPHNGRPCGHRGARVHCRGAACARPRSRAVGLSRPVVRRRPCAGACGRRARAARDATGPPPRRAPRGPFFGGHRGRGTRAPPTRHAAATAPARAAFRAGGFHPRVRPPTACPHPRAPAGVGAADVV